MSSRPGFKQVNLTHIPPASLDEAMARLEQYYPGPYALITSEISQQVKERFDAEYISLDLPIQEIRASVNTEATTHGERH